MTAPARLRLSRAKGARLPEGAAVVTRGTAWGNPWSVDRVWNGLEAAADFRARGARSHPLVSARNLIHWPEREAAAAAYDAALDRLAAEAAVAQFRALAEHFRAADPAGFEAWIAPLRGRDLACWCAPGAPCHADVLLEMANR